jgi:DNA-binding NtrC family response regulator
MLEILVVATDRVERCRIVHVLETAGHRVRGAATFDEAKHALTCMSPDVVIAEERLGAYNGLQVLLRARAENPCVGAVVVTRVADRAVEADAKRLDVECEVEPADSANWLAIVSRTLRASRELTSADYPGGSSSNRPFIPLPKAETTSSYPSVTAAP